MDLSIKAPDIAAAPESLKQFSLGLCSPDHHHHCCCTITTITDSNVASGNIFSFLPISLLVLSLFLPVFYSWTPSYPSSPVLPSLLCFWLRLLSGRYSERLLEWQSMVEEKQMPKTTQEEDSKQRTDREKHNLDKVRISVFMCMRAQTCSYLCTKANKFSKEEHISPHMFFLIPDEDFCGKIYLSAFGKRRSVG